MSPLVDIGDIQFVISKPCTNLHDTANFVDSRPVGSLPTGSPLIVIGMTLSRIKVISVLGIGWVYGYHVGELDDVF